MDNVKLKLQKQLIANVIKDKCTCCEDIIFSESWCTQDRCIRFTLPIFRALFPPAQNCGDWDSGDFVMFEVNNKSDSFEIACMFSMNDLPTEYKSSQEMLFKAFGEEFSSCLWNSTCTSMNPNDIFDFFDGFLNEDLPNIEKNILKTFISPIHEGILEEGMVKRITSIRYERNRLARELCLSYYGKSCRKCGLNFGRDFGEKYADLIEVHHVVPLSEIGESYIVNPIKDLIPLCPNCHAMVHWEENTAMNSIKH